MNPSRISKTAIFLVSILFSSPSFCQHWLWASNLGDSTYGESHGIVNDANDNFYIAGNLFPNALIAKYDVNGNLVWIYKDENREFLDIVFDNENHLYATGKGDFLLKIDTAGNKLWAIGSDAIGTAITIDTEGYIYLSGDFSHDVIFGPDTLYAINSTKGFIAKADTAGNFIWAKELAKVQIESIKTGHDNSIYLTGNFRDTIDIATPRLIARGDHDILVAKMDTAGNFTWARQAGGNRPWSNFYQWERGYDIAIDENNFLYVTGSFLDTAFFDTEQVVSSSKGNNIFLAKYDLNGNVQWVKSAGGDHDAEGRSIAIDTEGNIWIGGSYVGPTLFGTTMLTGWQHYDAFLAKYNPDGNLLGVLKAGGESWNEVITAIEVTASGIVAATGYINSTSYFDNIVLHPSGRDIFISSTGISLNVENPTPSPGKIIVYPNPANHILNLDLPGSKNANVDIYSISGKMVLSKTEVVPGKNIINISGLSAGFYLLQLTNEDGTISRQKFVKQ